MTKLSYQTVVALTALISVSAIMLMFYDRFWWPVDEGVYAYVAQRAIAGDVIHRDVMDLHGGYGNLLNIFAFRIFGEDLLSLRYPLVLISFMQCTITFIILLDRGSGVALTGTIAVAAFSFVQFPNPSANWHALGTFFCLCLCLEKMQRGSSERLFLAGLIVGVCFFTRQLSGVFLCLGLICVLLSKSRHSEVGSRVPALLYGGISFAGLLMYLASKQQIFGMLWGGIWPLGMILITTMQSRMTWGFAGRTTLLVLAGFLVAGLPLAAIAASQSVFSFWIQDILFTALLINGQEFIGQASFLPMLYMAWENLTGVNGTSAMVSGAAWIILILSVPLLGVCTASSLKRPDIPHPTIILAVFWTIGALHYQILIYLLFVLPAVLIAFLLMRPTPAVLAVVLMTSSWALVFQAGQPLERGLAGVIAGQRSPANTDANLPRVSLRVQADDAAVYRTVIDAIESTALPGEPLMTIPMDPELNFMTARKSPVRYYGTPLGLRTEDDVNDTLARLDAVAPLFVVHRRQDKYLTSLSAKLLAHVQTRSEAPLRLGPFDLYRYRGSPLADESSAGQ